MIEAETIYGGKQPSLFDQISELDPARADAVISLADGLLSRADQLFAALEEVSIANTARPLLDIVVDEVLSAAVTLLPEA